MHTPTPKPTPTPAPAPTPKAQAGLTVKTGVQAGDYYPAPRPDGTLGDI